MEKLSNLAIILPSVSGKTTLSKKLTFYVQDIDELPNDEERINLNNAIKNALLNNIQEKWNIVNDIWRLLVISKATKNKILLCHSPDQLPLYYNYYIINTPEHPYIDSVIDPVRKKTAILNRNHLKDEFSNSHLYNFIEEPELVYKFISDIINKLKF